MVVITVLCDADREGTTLRTRAQHVAADFSGDVRVDVMDMAPAAGQRVRVSGVEQLPALMVDDRVVMQGRVPKLRELDELVRDAVARDKRLERQGIKKDLHMADDDVPRCGLCGRDCALDAPACARGRGKARELGVKPRGAAVSQRG